jgi:phosphoribosylaminoimidazole carboxylase (NCAIR synthetase)
VRTTDKPLAIVLGGTVPHKALIENLRHHGWETLLIDYYDNPPAAEVADRHVKESTLDQDKVLEIARREKAELVISGCVDQANAIACYVAEKLRLPAPYSYKTAQRVTDKVLMKEGLIRAGVPTARYQVVHANEIKTYRNSEYPKVVKPRDCNGSKGVRKVFGAEELEQALQNACNESRSDTALVEDFNQGREVNGYFFVGENEPVELFFMTRNIPWIEGGSAMQSIMTVGPEPISESVRSNFYQAVKRIAKEFRLSNTPLVVQAHIHGDSFKVVEFAPRVGGGLSFRAINITMGFDIIDAIIKSYLGESVDTSGVRAPGEMVAIVHLYGTGGVLDRVDGMDELIAQGVVEELHMHKTPGMEMSCVDLAARNRVCGVIIRGSDVPELETKMKTMVEKTRVLATNGKDVLNRTPFLGYFGGASKSTWVTAKFDLC